MGWLDLRLIIGLLAILPFCNPFHYAATAGYAQSINSFVLIMFGLLLAKTWRSNTVSFGLAYLGLLIGITPLIHDRPFTMSWLLPVIGVLALLVFSFTLSDSSKRQERFDYLCKGLLVGAIANALFACLQWLIAYIDQSDLPIFGFLNQRNIFVHYVTLGSVALAWLWSSKQINHLTAFFFGGVLAIGAMLGGSRSSFLYALALLPFAVSIFWQPNSFNRCLAWIVSINISALLFPIILGLIQPDSAIINTAQKNSQTNDAITRVVSNMDHHANQTRLLELQQGWRVFKQNPIIGVGWDGFAKSQLEIMQQPPFSTLENWVTAIRTHTHNLFLQLLVEYGLLSLPLIFLLFFQLFRIWNTRSSNPIALPSLALLSIMLAHSMVEYPLWHYHFFTIFIILLILARPEKGVATPPFLLVKGLAISGLMLSIYGAFLLVSLNKVSRTSWIHKENREKAAILETLRYNPFVDASVHNILLALREPAVPIKNSLELCNNINRYRATPKSFACEAALLHKEGKDHTSILLFSQKAYPQHKNWIRLHFKEEINLDANN